MHMARVEKTVFLSYRRSNIAWALAIYQNLTHHRFDVFFDYQSIDSGDFESVILENIRARAHFLVVLTPSALERCEEPDDWLRREIEIAIDAGRNIVPLMLEGFNFDTPSIAKHLTGKMALLRRYSGLNIPADYFDAAMDRLRDRYLHVALEAVLHPASAVAQRAALDQQAAAGKAAAVQRQDLTAEEWFERGYKAADREEGMRCFSEVIRLKPDHALAYYNRAVLRRAAGDADGALVDFDTAIRLDPGYPRAYSNRGTAHYDKGEMDAALADFDTAIRLDPRYTRAYFNRALVNELKRDYGAAIADYRQYLVLGGDTPDGDAAAATQIRKLEAILAAGTT